MKIVFAAYRDWALDTIYDLGLSSKHQEFRVETQEELLKTLEENEDIAIVFLIGWSWIIPKEICEKFFIVGLHPSDLPAYAGGSPIQHQILDGITQSQMSVFHVTSEIDGGSVYMKEPISLAGNMNEIFYELSRASHDLIWKFIKKWPNIKELSHDKVVPRKRLKPEHSIITKEMFQSMTARELYNFIRCKENPYPNACFTDETGTVYFTSTSFKEPPPCKDCEASSVEICLKHAKLARGMSAEPVTNDELLIAEAWLKNELGEI